MVWEDEGLEWQWWKPLNVKGKGEELEMEPLVSPKAQIAAGRKYKTKTKQTKKHHKGPVARFTWLETLPCHLIAV